jgi:hypothetical protein
MNIDRPTFVHSVYAMRHRNINVVQYVSDIDMLINIVKFSPRGAIVLPDLIM